ncbi:MAG: ComEC/Rec2 family competence protein, partial [Patescibacteria group bacterium]
ARFSAIINSYLPQPHASLLNGILFGIEIPHNNEFYTQLKQVGLIHIVVLSGMNITILASIVAHATSKLEKRLSICIILAVIVSFVLFVGPKPPIVRAAIMGSIAIMAPLFGRTKQGLYLLFLSLVIIAVFKPDWIFSISFQLSFSAAFGIMLLSNKYQLNLSEQKPKKYTNFLFEEFKTSLSAYLFTTPIIFFYFREMSFLAPISNVFVGFTIPFIMILGFVTVLLGFVHNSLGIIPSYILYGLLEYIHLVVVFLSRITIGYYKF